MNIPNKTFVCLKCGKSMPSKGRGTHLKSCGFTLKSYAKKYKTEEWVTCPELSCCKKFYKDFGSQKISGKYCKKCSFKRRGKKLSIILKQQLSELTPEQRSERALHIAEIRRKKDLNCFHKAAVKAAKSRRKRGTDIIGVQKQKETKRKKREKLGIIPYVRVRRTWSRLPGRLASKSRS